MASSSSGSLCAVDGCRSSKRRDKNLSFFHLPADVERRKTWIELIGRPDLASPHTKINSYIVCSLHFDPSVITYTPKLQPNAVPTKLIPPQPTTSDSTAEANTKEISTQTEYSTINILSATTTKNADMKSESVQAIRTPSSNTPRKRKLNKDLSESNLKRRRLQNELDNIKQEVKSKET